ncbi:MAG: MATE family efflux transporter [Clostridia bacterium]|nr:MATE family efflux transporter [Clostridia bacterium]
MKRSREEQREYKKNMMLTEPMPKVILTMAGPTIVAFLINAIYGLVDTYFVSGLGTNATAAISVNTSLDQFIMMVGSLLAVGANSYIARLLGANEKEKASEILSTAFFLVLVLGLVITGIGFAFMRPMVRLMGATPTCEQYSVDYATYILLASPFMVGGFVMNQCLRAEGSPIFSMFGLGFGGVLNCVLDPIFINTLGMGVAGASLATAISKLVSFSILLFPYLTKRTLLRIAISKFRCTWENLKEIISVGLPSMLRSGLSVVAAIVLNKIAGGISDSVMAGIGVTNRVMMFPFSILLGYGTGFQPVAGYNWGAKRYDRVRSSYQFSAWSALLGSAVMAALLAIFAEWTIGLFSETDPVMREIGALSIRLQCLALPIHAWVMIVNMFCAGLGFGKGAMVLATARQGTCFLPFAHLAAHIGGAYGVAAIQAVADIISMFLAIPLIIYMLKKVKQAESSGGGMKLA